MSGWAIGTIWCIGALCGVFLQSYFARVEHRRRLAILKALREKRELRGIDLHRLLSARSGVLYLTLMLMEEDGDVASRVDPDPPPARKDYPGRLYSLGPNWSRGA